MKKAYLKKVDQLYDAYMNKKNVSNKKSSGKNVMNGGRMFFAELSEIYNTKDLNFGKESYSIKSDTIGSAPQSLFASI